MFLLKQSDGSFTGYEVADAPPYGVLNVTPHFHNQLTPCPPPPAGDYPQAAPTPAFAQLPSGGYLTAQIGDVFGAPGALPPAPLYVLQFDASLRLISSAPMTYPAATNTLTFADLNGDGNPDLIVGVGYSASSGLLIFLGNGGTSFQTSAGYAMDLPVDSVAVADVNGDGKPDLIVGSGLGAGGQVSVLLGNGDGTFQPEKVVVTGTGAPYAVAVGDLNGDGIPDLAFTTDAPVPIVLVALGKGDGTFLAPVSYPSNGYGSIAIGDVNGDGIPDLVASGISILFGDGTGAFPTRRDYVQPTSGEIVLTDFDGDGTRDIVTGVGASWILSGTAVAVLYGRRDGTFFGAPISVVPGSNVGDNVATAIESADLDGDGIPDLLYAELETGITALHGNGDGTFNAVWQVMPHGSANSLAIGDFNGDGIPDFATDIASAVAGVVEVFLGVGDGTFQPPMFIQVGSSLGQGNLVAADFNGDGKLDLALAWSPYNTGINVTSSVFILLGKGDGTFGSPMTAMTAPGFFTITTGDFNKDGAPDVAIATDGSLGGTPSGVTILLGKGDGTFTAGATVPLTIVGYSLVAADFNRDGKLDLAVTTANPSAPYGGFVVLLGMGNGTFQEPALYPSSSSNLREADLNGDGIPDLVSGSIYGAPGGFGYFLGNGDGSFQPEIQLGPPWGPIVAADLNGDGQVDIASGGAAIGIAAMLNMSRLRGLPPRRRAFDQAP
jgi:hypothetical protein